jgi:hypothetical protein
VNYTTHVKQDAEYVEGRTFRRRGAEVPDSCRQAGQLLNYAKEDEGYGRSAPPILKTGALKWEFKHE